GGGWGGGWGEKGRDGGLRVDGGLRGGDDVRPQPPVVIVDIDRRSLERLGAWPLPRAVIARLIEAIAAAKPRVVVVDILFADADTRSPAGLARRLGEMTGRRDLVELAQTLPAGARLSAAARKQAPTVLGFGLDPLAADPVPRVPILMRGPPSLAGIWDAPGATGPVKIVADAAAGIGALALAGDADGVVRRA